MTRITPDKSGRYRLSAVLPEEHWEAMERQLDGLLRERFGIHYDLVSGVGFLKALIVPTGREPILAYTEQAEFLNLAREKHQAPLEELPDIVEPQYETVELHEVHIFFRMGYAPRNQTVVITPVKMYWQDRFGAPRDDDRLFIRFGPRLHTPRWARWIIRKLEDWTAPKSHSK